MLKVNDKKEYLKNYQFKLKNFNNTNDKYKDYKNDKFKELNKLVLHEIKTGYGYDYENDIEYNLKSSNWYIYNCYEKNNYNSKSNIRELANHINYITVEVNKKLIENVAEYNNIELNENEKRIFTIKFYLKNYKFINKSMLNVLKLLVLN